MTRKITPVITMTLALMTISSNAHAEVASRAYVDSGLAGKMDAMTVDTTPTADSTNLVTSGGVAAAITAAAPTVDAVPTDDSTNAVSSGGVYDALAGKMDTMTVDTTPTADSTNLVTSGGVKTYVDTQKDAVMKGNEQNLAQLAENAGYDGVQDAVRTAENMGVAGLMLNNEIDIIDLYDMLEGDEEKDYPGKQDKLGGGNDAGKVVTATDTAGDVTYTAIDTTPTADSTNLVTSGGVADAIEASGNTVTEITERLNNLGGTYGSGNSIEDAIQTLGRGTARGDGYQKNAIITTEVNGFIQSTTGSFLKNEHIAGDANIDIGKLKLPTPPTSCNTQGCMLVFYNNQYVWEPIMREAGETVATAGAVSATTTTVPVQNSYSRYGYGDIVCPGGYELNGSTCEGVGPQ